MPPWSSPVAPSFFQPDARRLRPVAAEAKDVFLDFSSVPNMTTVIDPSLFKNLAPKDLTPILQKIKDAQGQGDSTGIPGFDSKQAQQAALDVIKTGKADPKFIMGTVFGVGAAGLCAATGAGASITPLCAAGGKALGEMIAGWQVTPNGPTPTASSQLFVDTMNADRQYLKSARDEIYYNLSSGITSDALRDKVIDVLNDFFPQVSHDVQQEVEARGSPEWLGFYVPFAWECLAGQAFSDGCPIFEWEMDFSGPPIKPGWGLATLDVMIQKLADKGLDAAKANLEFLRSNSNNGARWDTGAQSERLFTFYTDVRQAVWPAIQQQLEQQLQDLFVTEAVKTSQPFLESVDALANALTSRACSGDDPDCKAQVLQKVGYYTDQLATQDPSAVSAEINKEYPPPVTDTNDDTSNSSSSSSGWSAGKVILTIGAIVGLAFGGRWVWQHRDELLSKEA